MSRPKAPVRFRLAGPLAGAMLFALGAGAQVTNSFAVSTNQVSELTIALWPGETVGREQVLRAHLRSGTNEFIFVVPDGLRAHTPSGGTLLMVSREMSYSVAIRVIEPPRTQEALAEALGEEVAQRYPQGSSLETFATVVADREGTGVQLRQALAGDSPRLVRVLWVPFRAGLMEFALNADSKSAATGLGALDMILLTFRSNEAGRLVVVRRSEKT